MWTHFNSSRSYHWRNWVILLLHRSLYCRYNMKSFWKMENFKNKFNCHIEQLIPLTRHLLKKKKERKWEIFQKGLLDVIMVFAKQNLLFRGHRHVRKQRKFSTHDWTCIKIWSWTMRALNSFLDIFTIQKNIYNC